MLVRASGSAVGTNIDAIPSRGDYIVFKDRIDEVTSSHVRERVQSVVWHFGLSAVVYVYLESDEGKP